MIRITNDLLDDLVLLGERMGHFEIGGIMFAESLENESDDLSEDIDIDSDGHLFSEGVSLMADSLVLPKQEVLSAETTFDDEWMAEFYRAKEKSLSSDLLVWWHSHHTMGVTPSQQDWKTLEQLTKGNPLGLSCMLITNNESDFSCHIGSFAHGIYTKGQLEVDIPGTKKQDNFKIISNEIEEKRLKNVRKKVIRYNFKRYNLGKNKCSICRQDFLYSELNWIKSNEWACNDCMGGEDDFTTPLY